MFSAFFQWTNSDNALLTSVMFSNFSGFQKLGFSAKKTQSPVTCGITDFSCFLSTEKAISFAHLVEFCDLAKLSARHSTHLGSHVLLAVTALSEHKHWEFFVAICPCCSWILGCLRGDFFFFFMQTNAQCTKGMNVKGGGATGRAVGVRGPGSYTTAMRPTK